RIETIVMAKRKADKTAEADTDQSKKKAPRLKVLSMPTLLRKQQQQIYESNATNSPLLKLPPEIRNRIWHLVLGGRTLHTYTHLRRGVRHVGHSICRVPDDDEAIAKRIVRHNELSGEAEGFQLYHQRHSTCLLSEHSTIRPAPLSLNILRSCRQVHEEGALLPFKLNEFVCVKLNDLAPFLQSIFQAQAHAIETITLACSCIYATVTLAKLLKTKLKGLRELKCFVQMRSWHADLPAFRSHWSATVSQFGGMATASAMVLPYNAEYHRTAPGRSCPREAMRAWAKEIEGDLVAAGR
ncbi:hypothetical protein B0A55_12778, partial [Friedmanniomyces simplex]